ncbi:MAG TPA: DUF2905 domain-containing protein [Terracidiphilus sp.]|nr:DUF2905 domain-containing protein [Terracidiphilus sp.]
MPLCISSNLSEWDDISTEDPTAAKFDSNSWLAFQRWDTPLHGSMMPRGPKRYIDSKTCSKPDTLTAGDVRLSMMDLGKVLFGLGLLVSLIGAGLMLASRTDLTLGRLPGDFVYRGRHLSFYFPLGSSILISVVLSALIYLFSRFHR